MVAEEGVAEEVEEAVEVADGPAEVVVAAAEGDGRVEAEEAVEAVVVAAAAVDQSAQARMPAKGKLRKS